MFQLYSQVRIYTKISGEKKIGTGTKSDKPLAKKFYQEAAV